ncbi:MAG: hypothetical protein EHM33_01905 [Chloroflexi bacterium]|nr:MAG: hypothetical protein EHM33_01905 [Chloroflexota bacterium]
MAGTSSLPLAGVEAIVEGLSSFQGDIGKMNSALDSLRPRQTLLQRAFSSAWESVKDFGREILNVAEFALGQLLADAIEFVVTKIKELISATIDAGSEFQTLELRLQRLNFNALIASGEDATRAVQKSIQVTKEQLEWLQKLAATTPFDNTDISNTYTLARSYGFLDQESRQLTEDISDFVSGMGLTNVEITRIMKNFGQMRGLGKIMQRDLNDLATGGFVPVNRILERVSKNTGIAMEDMDDFRKTGDSVTEFMKAFSQIVEEEFGGAAEVMAKTFKAANDNALDVVKSIGGLQVVKPVLDAIGARVAAFVSSFTDNPQRWDRMVAAAQRVGTELSKIVNSLFDLIPSSESLADSAVSAIEGMADWLNEHGPGIKTFFKELGVIVGGVADKVKATFFPGQEKKTGGVPAFDKQMMAEGPQATFGQGILTAVQKIADFINNTLIPALDKFFQWVEDNGPLIEEFWTTVWDIIGEVFDDITSQPGKEGEGGGGILESITKFMQFVIDNKDDVVKWVEVLWSVFVVWQVISTLWGIVIGIIITLGATIIGLISLVSGLIAVLSVPLVGAIALVIGILGALYLAFQTNLFGMRTWITNAVAWFDNLGREASIGVQKMIVSIRGIDWQMLGKGIIDGIIRGLTAGAGGLAQAAVRAAMSAYSAAKAALGMNSPSKLFEGIGIGTMEGFAQGIERAAGMAVGAMQNAVGQVAMPAISSMAAAQAGGNTITNNRTANLTVNSSAPTESIIQDFNMLESLMGA